MDGILVLVLDGDVVGNVKVKLFVNVCVGVCVRIEMSEEGHKVVFGFAIDLFHKAAAHVKRTGGSREIENTGDEFDHHDRGDVDKDQIHGLRAEDGII